MRLDSFDLNLLVAFEILLDERSVTRAALRLNVTQSAMSASLKRLRDAFNDEILILHGKAMVPTPLALSLAPQIAAAIATLRNLIVSGTRFDPRTSARTFRIAASDYITTVVLVPLLAQLGSDAPRVGFDISLPNDETAKRMGKGEFDLTLTPEQFVDRDHPTELLFEEGHVVVGWEGNPLLSGPLTAEAFGKAGHVAAHIDGRNSYIELMLASLGIERNIEVRAPSFIQIPWLLPGTLRLALMHERLARLMAPGLRLTVVAPPFEVPKMREMIQYHSTRERDAGLSWLRDRLKLLAADS